MGSPGRADHRLCVAVSLRVINTVSDLESVHGLTFVPTMGALHDGHLSLVQAGLAHGDEVIMSIFVNPKQFAPGEDFESYPRTLEQDLALAESAGTAVVFAPDVDTMYPLNDAQTGPPLPAVATEPGLEDGHRPQFFGGVCTVVARLLDLVRSPDRDASLHLARRRRRRVHRLTAAPVLPRR